MILSIIKKEIKKNMKEKGTIFWLFLMPIMFIVIFSSIFSNTNYNFQVPYVDQDQSQDSKEFLKQIESIKGFELVEESDSANALDKLRNGKLTTFLFIPKGFSENMSQAKENPVQLYYDGTDQQSVSPILAVLNNISKGYREGKIRATLNTVIKDPTRVNAILTPPITIETKEEASKKVNMVTQIVPGYTVMFVFFIIINMVRSFVKDRESGMLARLASTPMNSIQYLIGMWVPHFLTVLIQIAVLLGFGHFVYDLQLGNIFAIIALSFSLALMTSGLGLMIALLVKSEQVGIALTQIITMGGAVLGGLWFPIDLMPSFIQKLSHFIPQSWALQGYQDIMIRGAALGQVVLPVILLLGVAFISLIVASLSYKNFLKGATS